MRLFCCYKLALVCVFKKERKKGAFAPGLKIDFKSVCQRPGFLSKAASALLGPALGWGFIAILGYDIESDLGIDLTFP